MTNLLSFLSLRCYEVNWQDEDAMKMCKCSHNLHPKLPFHTLRKMVSEHSQCYFHGLAGISAQHWPVAPGVVLSTTQAFFLPFVSHPNRPVFETGSRESEWSSAIIEPSVYLSVHMIYLPGRAVGSWMIKAITRGACCGWRITFSALILSRSFH